MNEDHIKQYGLRVAEKVRDECGDLAHKYVSAEQFIRSAMNLQGIVDGVPTPRELSRARVADAAKTVMNKITIPNAGVTERLAMLGDAIAGHPRDFMPGEHVAQTVPRDVLMLAMNDLLRAQIKIGNEGWIGKNLFGDIEGIIPKVSVEAIADRYASKVQPERCQCCGYLVTESEHKGCLRAGRAAIQPEPVNQQPLAALKELRNAYQEFMGLPACKANAAIAAAQAAQPVVSAAQKFATSEAGRKYVADFFAKTLRRHDFTSYINERLAADFACVLAGALSGMQHASAQPVAMADGARKVFICDACEGVYADEPVTDCDCTVSEKTTFSEGYIVMLSAAKKPEGGE